MARYWRIAAIALAVCLTAAGFLYFAATWAIKTSPEFYAEAVDVSPRENEVAGEELERRVLELRNDARAAGQWETVLTAEQINGWLASDLPEKFAGALPQGVSDPRVAIEEGSAKIACRYVRDEVATVLSLTVDLHMTEEENVVAVQIRQARAGLLPLPLKRLLARAGEAADRFQVVLRWTEADGDPVALITTPSRYDEESGKRLILESVELRDGEIFLAGRTEEENAIIEEDEPAPSISAAD